MIQNAQRVALVLAISLTIVLLAASVVPSAGQVFSGKSHWFIHFISFAIFAFAWRYGLHRISTLVVALAVIAFGFIHEAIEMVGHTHNYELGDAVIDSIGTISGVLLATLAARRLDPK